MFEVASDLGTDLAEKDGEHGDKGGKTDVFTFHVLVRDSVSLRLLNATKDLFP